MALVVKLFVLLLTFNGIHSIIKNVKPINIVVFWLSPSSSSPTFIKERDAISRIIDLRAKYSIYLTLFDVTRFIHEISLQDSTGSKTATELLMEYKPQDHYDSVAANLLKEKIRKNLHGTGRSAEFVIFVGSSEVQLDNYSWLENNMKKMIFIDSGQGHNYDVWKGLTTDEDHYLTTENVRAAEEILEKEKDLLCDTDKFFSEALGTCKECSSVCGLLDTTNADCEPEYRDQCEMFITHRRKILTTSQSITSTTAIPNYSTVPGNTLAIVVSLTLCGIVICTVFVLLLIRFKSRILQLKCKQVSMSLPCRLSGRHENQQGGQTDEEGITIPVNDDNNQESVQTDEVTRSLLGDRVQIVNESEDIVDNSDRMEHGDSGQLPEYDSHDVVNTPKKSDQYGLGQVRMTALEAKTNFEALGGSMRNIHGT